MTNHDQRLLKTYLHLALAATVICPLFTCLRIKLTIHKRRLSANTTAAQSAHGPTSSCEVYFEVVYEIGATLQQLTGKNSTVGLDHCQLSDVVTTVTRGEADLGS